MDKRNIPFGILLVLAIVLAICLSFLCIYAASTTEIWQSPTRSAAELAELLPDSATLPPTLPVIPPTSTPRPTATHDPALPTVPPRTEIVIYDVQPNDTLSSIAQTYGVELTDLMYLNNLTNPDWLYAGQTLTIPPNVPQEPPPANLIIPDSEIINSPAAVDFDIADFIRQKGGYLAFHQEEVDDTQWSGASIVTRIAKEYSVNPRILLAVLEHQSNWVTHSSGISDQSKDYPLGYTNEVWRQGLYRQLAWAANSLNFGYYAWQVQGVRWWVLSDNVPVQINPEINAGTAAVQYLMSNLKTSQEWQEAVSPQGLAQTYQALFGDPYDYEYTPLIPAQLSQPPLQLPFEPGAVWSFTSGPHSAWGTNAAWAALDFAPPGEPMGCIISEDWITAAADGLVVRSTRGAVVQDLDGDGLEQTGWTILYMHVSQYERVPQGTYLLAGEPIGHASCEGGFASGAHVHIARRYNGVWISADGNLPFIMDGWVSQGSGYEYNGFLIKDNLSVEAWDDYVAQNQIHR